MPRPGKGQSVHWASHTFSPHRWSSLALICFLPEPWVGQAEPSTAENHFFDSSSSHFSPLPSFHSDMVWPPEGRQLSVKSDLISNTAKISGQGNSWDLTLKCPGQVLGALGGTLSCLEISSIESSRNFPPLRGNDGEMYESGDACPTFQACLQTTLKELHLGET